ncbi:MAG: AsmA-like C-terminal domain-containing protein [Proteobacteria bacterium]|nr:AsmA-like C-terminal domain-containing protein [Pseudomonadota bacterium]MBU1686534.1 AsmA-like C-terminal domain-containing protein [Pseudomonadota bacterium]
MKKAIIIIAGLSLILLGVVFFVPSLFHWDRIQSQLVKRLSTEIGWQVEAQQVDWYWLPLPHFSLFEVTLSRENASITLPETRLYPRFKSLLDAQPDFGEIQMVHPSATITNLTGLPKNDEKIRFRGKISIINGKLNLGKNILKKIGIPGSDLEITGIDGMFEVAPGWINLLLSAKSSLADGIFMKGYYDLINNTYQGKYELNSFKLYQVFPSLLAGGLELPKSGLSFSGQIKGQGNDQLEASINGNFPCFTTPSVPEKLFLDCGEAHLRVEKNAGEITVHIDQLNLNKPGLILSGKVSRLHDSSPSDSIAEPVWLLDLYGKDINAGSLRTSLLTLWPNDEIVKIVSDIVLDGLIGKASYYFRGPVEDFMYLEKMKITADVVSASIHPPMTPLFLNNASGPIEITNGYLSGRNLTARYQGSSGKNCSLYLDLLSRDNAFRLDLDLEVDLTNLPPVLDNLVNHDLFKSELHRFTNVTGHASGHLTLGDTLDNILVGVDVNRMKGHFSYNRLTNDCSVQKGDLSIRPEKVSWKNIQGSSGPHLIHESSGDVSWQQQVMINLTSLSASVESGPLMQELATSKALPDEIHKAISRAEGPVEVSNVNLQGPAAQPQLWQYSFDLDSKGSRWESPMLPQPILVERARGKITHENILLKESKLWFFEHPLSLEGDVLHHLFTDLNGWLRISGTLKGKFAQWLKDKKSIPEKYFPRIPCTLDKMKIGWKGKTSSLEGTVLSGLGEADSVKARINLESNQQKLMVHELVFIAKEEIGRLSLEHPQEDNSILHMNWQGFLSGSTLNELFPVSLDPSGHLEGDFFIQAEQLNGSNFFQGWLKARNMNIPSLEERPEIRIDSLILSSGEQDGELNIKNLILKVADEQMMITGSVQAEKEIIKLDLNVTSTKLSRQNVDELINVLNTIQPKPSPPPTGENSYSPPNTPWALIGRIEFNIDQYLSTPSNIPDKENTPPEHTEFGTRFSVTPLRGYISLLNDRTYSVDIRSSNLCGLDLSGQWHSVSSLGDTSFNIYTDSKAPPRFENVLTCLGIDQHILEGVVHLDAKIKGQDNLWKEGNIALYSDQGRIRRLNALSKVFRFINLTDFFAKGGLPDLEKEGFGFSRLDFHGHIADNHLIVDEGIIFGDGLNLFLQGDIGIADRTADMVLMVAPLKTLDVLVTSVPLIGKIVGGKDKTVISIPVRITGDIRDPVIEILPAEEIGKGILTLIGKTLLFPFIIVNPETNQFQ